MDEPSEGVLSHTTPEQILKDIEEHRTEWLKGTEGDPTMQLELLQNVYLMGKWLSWRLRWAGADADTQRKICRALGQRLFGWKQADHAEIAAEVYNRWLQGDEDTPGAELGAHLAKEMIGK